jgi:hypothetical protein
MERQAAMDEVGTAVPERVEVDEEGNETYVPGGKRTQRRIGPLTRKATNAGNLRTGAAETAAQRAAPTRNRITQDGKTRGITGTQAMRQGNEMAEEMSPDREVADNPEGVNAAEARLERQLRQQVADAKLSYEAVEKNPRVDPKRKQKLRDTYDSLRSQLRKLQSDIDKKAGAAQPRTKASTKRQVDDSKQKGAVPLLDEDTAKGYTDATGTQASVETRQALRDGDVLGTARQLAAGASTPEVRSLVESLVPFLEGVKIGVDQNVKHKGKTVAGFFPNAQHYVAPNAGHTDSLYFTEGKAARRIRMFLRRELR